MRCPHCNEAHPESAGGVCPYTSLPIATTGIVGHVIRGKYKVQRLLAVGSMGEVYECDDLVAGTRVCMKRLLPRYRSHSVLRARFEREAEAAASVAHPHVVEILDIGLAEDGIPFFVMPRLGGETLHDLMEREGLLPVGRACRILTQVLHALETAHERRVIHRDLKPENVFLVETEEGGADFVKLLDFGLSRTDDQSIRLSVSGVLVGTPAYASPEQVRGKRDIDHRTDLWAAGVMLFEMLGGELPYRAASPDALIDLIEAGPPPRLEESRPDAPPELCRVVERALSPDPARRFQNARAFRQAIAPWATDQGEAELRSSARRESKIAALVEEAVDEAAVPTWTPETPSAMISRLRTTLAPPEVARPVVLPRSRRVGLVALAVAGACLFVAWFVYYPR